MSIYNGFATRNQEGSYNKAIFSMLFLLQHTLLSSVKGEMDEEQFVRHFSKLYKKMHVMEQYKYLPPKFSFALKDMAKHYKKTPSQGSFKSLSAIEGFNSSMDTPHEKNDLRTIKETMIRKANSNNRQRSRRVGSNASSLKSKSSRTSRSIRSSSRSKKKLKFKKLRKPKLKKIKAKVLKQALNRRGFKKPVIGSNSKLSYNSPSDTVHLPHLRDDTVVPEVLVTSKDMQSPNDSKFSYKSDFPKIRKKSTSSQHPKQKVPSQSYTVNYKMNFRYFCK
ncbi:unnamed protein product [Moneuplotes crassus]|uniref:Uncharacterized protein n=1 Tax=Euplotes crassus TaxID=5936 RepID=A0AAD1XC42_EUPCR|nr:unnamed protein product [Moneuplotes crassus]